MWGHLSLVIITLSSRDHQENFYNRCHKDPWECSGTPGTMFCSMQTIQIRISRAEQAKELKKWLDTQFKKTDCIFFTVVFNIQKTSRLNVLLDPEMKQKPAGKSYWRVQISAWHNFLTVRAPEEASSPTSQTSVWTWRIICAGGWWGDGHRQQTKAVVNNMQASYPGMGP